MASENETDAGDGADHGKFDRTPRQEVDIKTQIGVLLVEKSETDAEALLRQLEKGGFVVRTRRVETAESLVAELDSQKWDIVLSAYKMPRFSGEMVLRILQEKNIDIPFIVISKHPMDEGAVDLLKNGAADFIRKGNWARLIPAVRRELREAAIRNDRRHAQKARFVAEARYRRLFENMIEGIFVSERDGVFRNVNPAMARMLGYDSPENLLKSIDNIEDQIYVERSDRHELLEKLAMDGKVYGFEARWRCLDGAIIWVSLHARAVFDDAGRLRCIEGIAENITQRKAAEKALRAAEEKYRGIFENAMEGIFQTAPDGRCISANPAMARILGYKTPEEMIEKVRNVNEQLYVDQAARARFLDLIARFHRVKSFESRVYRRDGEIIWISESTRAVIDSRGRLLYHEGFVENITERKKAEKELVRLGAAIEQAAEGVLIADPDWIVLYVNPAFEKISGYQRNEILGKHTGILKSGKHAPDFYKKIKETLASGEVWAGRLINRRRDGAEYEAEVTASPVFDESGEATNYVSVHRDITHEARLERQLRQSQKMEAIGTLAGGVAHDFNNILTAIMCYSEMAMAEAPPESRIPGRLDRVLMACRRAKELINQIITFSRQKEHEQRPVLINPIIKETLKLLRSSLPRTVEIRTKIEHDSSVISADPSQIHQVLMNLCTNAAHAMRDRGGILEVALKKTDLDGAAVRRRTELQPGPYVKLTVSDTGHGMDRGTMDRIFEPFFTTKGKGEGAGMGLAVIHGIVKSLGGEIAVYSEPDEGTVFNVYIPRIESPAEDIAKPAETIPHGTESILFVDDEPVLVEITNEMLEAIGYKVTSKTLGTEAFETFKKAPENFDLIITDMTMPKMTGERLARKCLEIRPDIPIILCTGFSELITEEKAKEAGIRAYMMKPLLLSELARTIREVLDG